MTVYVVPGHLARVSKKIELAQKDGNVVFLLVVTDGRKLESWTQLRHAEAAKAAKSPLG